MALVNSLDQESNSRSGGPNLFVKTGFEYFIDPKQSFALSGTISNGARNSPEIPILLIQGQVKRSFIVIPITRGIEMVTI